MLRTKRSKNEVVAPEEEEEEEESGWGVAVTTHTPLVMRLKKE